MKIPDKIKKAIICLVDICCVTGGLLLRKYIPAIMDALPGCGFARHGLPCPVCGGTRCVLNVLNFNFITAFKYNPFVFCLGAYLGMILIIWNTAWFTGSKKWETYLKKLANVNAIIVWGVIYLLFWGYRWITM